MFAVEITVYCEAIKPGCQFRALFYSRDHETFFGGSGPDAIEAIEWCIDEYIERGVKGGPIRVARDPRDRPGRPFAVKVPPSIAKDPAMLAVTRHAVKTGPLPPDSRNIRAPLTLEAEEISVPARKSKTRVASAARATTTQKGTKQR